MTAQVLQSYSSLFTGGMYGYSSWSEWTLPFTLPGVRDRPFMPSSDPARSSSLRPNGSHEFAVKGSDVSVGDTGVMVRVDDLSVPYDQRETVINARKFTAPAFTPRASATVTGTDDADDISIRQDELGNTILEVTRNGELSSVDLGRIASLTISGGAGEDRINVRVSDYYGGVKIDAGADNDIVSVDSSYGLERGVTVIGGTGDDRLTVSGEAIAVLIKAGAGNDDIDMTGVAGDSGLTLTRAAYGEAGSDLIYGSVGRDVISGGSGNDAIIAGRGDDILAGGSGNDLIYAGAGMDTVAGGTGNDTLWGGPDIDMLIGDAGDDLLMGEGGGDSLFGSDGDDRLYGGSSADEQVMYSRTGKVYVTGWYNYIVGGEGVDTFYPSSTSPNYIVDYSGDGSHLADYDSLVDVLV